MKWGTRKKLSSSPSSSPSISSSIITRVFPVSWLKQKTDQNSEGADSWAKMSELERVCSNSGERDSIKEIKVKTKQKRSKVVKAAYSPRTECKIRALEEMKKARMMMIKMKKIKEEEEEVVMEGKTVFNSFAVVKISYDPEGDFRDSMVEMIREKGIRRSEDLEELLASYLALNSDEYHDIIIKVFRKVWFHFKVFH